MTLRTTLPAALAPVLRAVLADLGENVFLRRPERTDAANGSQTVELVQVPNVPDPIPVVLVGITAAQAQREWGPESPARVQGLASLDWPIQVQDRLKVQTGSLAGQELEVLETRPTDAGGLLELGLVARPALPDFGR